ncbi:helix-turn-helix domain-containing protein [Streptomyces sp. NPDC090053]|uniref:helix-turn-helix domain-containing protein n=1 Tax=Streptomyces sp. NPDC090053 TaxID=3365932 RepID=UPI0038171324
MSRPGPRIPPLSVTDAQRAVLEGWLRRRTTAQALAQRSRIVLECAEGHSIMEVSRRLRITPDTVRTWRRRFLGRGLDGLCDDPRPGVPRKITDAAITISFARQRSPPGRCTNPVQSHEDPRGPSYAISVPRASVAMHCHSLRSLAVTAETPPS